MADNKEYIKTPVMDLKKAVEQGIEGKSGTLYKYCSELSSKRYEFQEVLAERMQFGYNPEMFSKRLTEAWDNFNKMKIGDGMITIKNIIDARNQMHSRGRTCFRIVALYFNAPGEDPAEVNEAVMEEKLRDWQHYSYASFFALATSFVGLYSRNLNENLVRELSALETVADAVRREDQTPGASKRGKTK